MTTTGIRSTHSLVVNAQYRAAIKADLRSLCELAANPRACYESRLTAQVDAVVRAMGEVFDLAITEQSKANDSNSEVLGIK